MPFGSLYPSQRKVVRSLVQGRIVYDLGAGDLGLSHQLVHLGAAQVVAVDAKPMPTPHTPQVTLLQKSFRECLQDPQCPTSIDVAFLSWPINHPTIANGLLHVLRRSRIVLYLGKTTDGTMCGDSDLFRFLCCRELLSYIPRIQNTLIVYGEFGKPHSPRHEEQAGIDVSKVYPFKAHYRRVTSKPHPSKRRGTSETEY